MALVHGDTPVEVAGELTWSPPPSPWLVWPLYVALALLAVAAGLLARSARPLGVLLLVGAAAALWHAAATPAPPETISSQAGAVLAAMLPALTAALVAGLGFRASRRGRGAMTGLLAVVLGWLLLVQGLPDVDVLWSANVLSAGPQPAARVAVALLLGLGLGLVLGGIAAVRRFREAAAPRRERSRPARPGRLTGTGRPEDQPASAANGCRTGGTPEQGVGALEVALEVDLHGGERRDVERAEPQALQLDRGLDRALEVVLVAAGVQVRDQGRLVLRWRRS